MSGHSGEKGTPAELRFVSNVRDARRLLTEADDLLYGIFGYPDDHPDRRRRLQLAEKAVIEAAALLDSSEADQ
jgi:hypothetical protein